MSRIALIVSRHRKALWIEGIFTKNHKKISLKAEQVSAMGHIATTYDFARDLTTFRVVGKTCAADFVDCLTGYYKASITRLNLWDATKADLSAISTDDIEELAYSVRHLVGARKGGKTAIVFDALHDFGLGRMLGALLEIAKLPIETYVCRSLDEARQWLGVGGATIFEINGDNDNKIFQRSSRGATDTEQALRLV